jgi:hypothetical protein
MRRAGIDQRQGHRRFALLDVDAARHRADRAAPAPKVAEDAADRRAGATAARILVGLDDVGLEQEVSRLHLALAHVRPGLQLAAVGKRALHVAALHRAVAVDQREAAGLLHEHLDDRFGRAEVVLAPPLLVGRNDRHRSERARAMRHFRLAALLVLVARARVGERRCREDERIQGALERHGSRAAESGTDYPKRHSSPRLRCDANG